MPNFPKSTGYQMRNSPAKKNTKLDLDTTGVKTSYDVGGNKLPSENFKTAASNTRITLSPGISVSERGQGVFKAGPQATINPSNKGEVSFGGRASYEFGKGSQQNYSYRGGFGGGFSGKASGSFDTKSGGEAKLSLGYKSTGGSVCRGKFQGGVCTVRTKGVSVFGKQNFKDKSTTVGAEARIGKVNVGGSYNLKTKTPSINIGYNFGR
jgi:hypothetical protein